MCLHCGESIKLDVTHATGVLLGFSMMNILFFKHFFFNIHITFCFDFSPAQEGIENAFFQKW